MKLFKEKIKEYILCAAIWFKDGESHKYQPNVERGFVVCGHRHHNCYHIAFILNGGEEIVIMDEVQGFLTNTNRFVDRKEAGRIAHKAGQIEKETTCLFSEDLY